MIHVIRRNCVSKYQDQKCGTGLRFHNATKEGARCTVCANTIKNDQYARNYGKTGGRKSK